MGIVLDYVAWRDDILEAIPFSDLSAFLALSTDDEHSLVSLCHFSHRCVSADELAGRDFDVELGGQLNASFFFCLATTVRDEDIRPVNQESVFMVDIRAPGHRLTL